MTRTFPAAVTGAGLVTPAGIGVEDTWQAVLEPRVLAVRDAALRDTGAHYCLRVPELGPEVLRGRGTAHLDPFIRYALVAVDEAVRESGLDPQSWDGGRIGVVVGTGIGGVETLIRAQDRFTERGPEGVSPYLHPRSLANMAVGTIASRYGITGPCHTVVSACASGAVAIGVARDLLRSGACDTVIACGTEAAVVPVVVSGFARMGALSKRDDPRASRPFDADRDGFVVSEGAAALVLERPEAAARRRAAELGRVLGYGCTTDAHHPVQPRPDGAQAEAAVRQALTDAGLRPEAVDHVNAHGTSTPLNDRVESELLARLFPHGPSVTANKGVLGHSLGAAGALEAVLSLCALRAGLVPPVANTEKADPQLPELDLVLGGPRRQSPSVVLSNSFGFGGANCALILGN
ncbi:MULTISPECIES: beta-ketoacyl-[acyl-carrier-protein] synthase family protein [Kitasatospora]|uniref:Beta-ketoacyl synthase N-terminal-like domain-containing protein n=1 Tax=Kitasatospora cystarginea TaxID=58350 RepID=A0ABP5RXV5_9ACTN